MFGGNVAREAVVCMAGDVLDGASSHDVGIDIDRIDRVGDAHDVVGGEDVADVARVALGTVADEDLGAVELDAAGLEIVLDDGIDEEVIALFGTISPKGCSVGTFIHGTVHGLNGGRGQGTSHIADAQTDDVRFGMLGFVGIHLLGYLRKEVAVGETGIVCVCANHVLLTT